MSKQPILPKELAEKLYKSDDKELKAYAFSCYPELGSKITDRIKSMGDIFKIAGKTETGYYTAMEENIAPMALKRLRLAQKVLVGDWKADWNDPTQKKYYPYFKWTGTNFLYAGSTDGRTYTASGSSLVFPNIELAEFAGKTFIKDYNESMS